MIVIQRKENGKSLQLVIIYSLESFSFLPAVTKPANKLMKINQRPESVCYRMTAKW